MQNIGSQFNQCSTSNNISMGAQQSQSGKNRRYSRGFVKDRINMFNNECQKHNKAANLSEINRYKNNKICLENYKHAQPKEKSVNKSFIEEFNNNLDETYSQKPLNDIDLKMHSNHSIDDSRVVEVKLEEMKADENPHQTKNNKADNDKLATSDNTKISDNVVSCKPSSNDTDNDKQFSKVLMCTDNKMSSEENCNTKLANLKCVDIDLNNKVLGNNEQLATSASANSLENLYVKHEENVDEISRNVFGQRSFESLQNIDFVEAYNRTGDELIVTSVALVERKLINEGLQCKDFIGDINSFQETFVGELIASEEYAVNNKLYFPDKNATNAELECDKEDESRENLEDDSLEIRNASKNTYERTIKTETVYDVFQNPRIAKVSNVSSSENATTPEEMPVIDNQIENAPKSPQEKRAKKDYIIEELLYTETQYIKHLKKVVMSYMPMFSENKIPTLLADKSQNLFGNIKKIFNRTKKFYSYLVICNYDHEEIAKTFIAFEKMFELYPFYYKNKPLADLYLLNDLKDIVKDSELQLNDRLGLASYLLTPIQRMGKYKLFLEQLQKELVKTTGAASENISKAINMVHKQMSKGNDYIAIDSIKDCPINLLDEGSFIIRDKFWISKPKKYETMLFLFEEILVFTTIDPKNQELFIYKDCIKLTEMGIVTFDKSSLIFHLKKFSSYKRGPTDHQEYIVEAKSIKTKKTWTEEIEKRLWKQLVDCKKEQSQLNERPERRKSITEFPVRRRADSKEYQSLPSDARKRNSKSMFYLNIEDEVD